MYLNPKDPNSVERLAAVLVFMIFVILIALLAGSGMHCNGTAPYH